MSIRTAFSSLLSAAACLLISGIAIAAADAVSIAPMEQATSEDSQSALVEPQHPLFQVVVDGGAIPNGIQVESLKFENADDDQIALTGVAQTAEEIGILAVQLEENGWLSAVEITTVTRRGRDRLFPWQFSMHGLISFRAREQLTAR